MPGFRGAREIHYDPDHTRTRKAAFAALPEYSPCARCKRSMWKHQLEAPDKRGRQRSALHWDHNGARTGYIGFSCADCNRKAGAREGGRRAAAHHHRTHRATTPHTGTPGPGW